MLAFNSVKKNHLDRVVGDGLNYSLGILQKHIELYIS
jgi:hypothetical protein